MKRILFNATHPEELRLAIVDGQKLLDLDIESSAYQQKKGNIYKGKVTRVEPSLEAAFVDYGMERQGFLPLKEISRMYFTGIDEHTPMAQVRIKDVIQEGQELVVQVEKEERGTKGAALTTFISLAGRYLVLMPNNPKGGGISRRIEGEERAELRQAMAELELPEDYAIIARTAGLGKGAEELQWDLDYLIHLWDAISTAATKRAAPFLIYQEGNLVVRTIRDYLRNDIGELVVDNPEVHERVRKFMEQVAPHNLPKLKLHQEETPLFSRFQIEHQIESAFSRDVRLESGGSLVFDRTEALVTVDVNSARATKGSDIEETALNTNLEAAEEVALQLRLRDIGGLIVIDFIDMTPARNQRAVENRLNESLKMDRARVQVGRISRFGILEMSRQRLRPSLGEASSLVCPRCNGTGHIRGVQSSALHILRLIQEEAMKENTAALHVHLPVTTATYLLNEKRHELNTMESRLATPIFIIPAVDMETPHFRIRRLRSDELETEEELPSYKIAQSEEEEPEPLPVAVKPSAEKPVVGQLVHAGAAPRAKRPREGLLVRLFKFLFGTGKKKKSGPAPKKRGGPRSRHRQQRPRPQASARGAQQPRTSEKHKKTPQEAKQGQQEKAGGGRATGRGRRARPRGRRPQGKTTEAGQQHKQYKGNKPDENTNRATAPEEKAPPPPQERKQPGKVRQPPVTSAKQSTTETFAPKPRPESRPTPPQPTEVVTPNAEPTMQAATAPSVSEPKKSVGSGLVQVETKPVEVTSDTAAKSD